jgi:hypothetical protein
MLPDILLKFRLERPAVLNWFLFSFYGENDVVDLVLAMRFHNFHRRLVESY